MIREAVCITNKLGLHARAAARLVRLASRYHSTIMLAREGTSQEIDSKSILGVLMLAATEGTRLLVSIDGPDESEAAQAIRALVESGFGEED